MALCRQDRGCWQEYRMSFLDSLENNLKALESRDERLDESRRPTASELAKPPRHGPSALRATLRKCVNERQRWPASAPHQGQSHVIGTTLRLKRVAIDWSLRRPHVVAVFARAGGKLQDVCRSTATPVNLPTSGCPAHEQKATGRRTAPWLPEKTERGVEEELTAPPAGSSDRTMWFVALPSPCA